MLKHRNYFYDSMRWRPENEKKRNQRLQTHKSVWWWWQTNGTTEKMSSKFRPIVKWHEKCIVGIGNATNTYAAHGHWAGIGEKNCIGNIDPCKMITNTRVLRPQHDGGDDENQHTYEMRERAKKRKKEIHPSFRWKTSANKGVSHKSIKKKCIYAHR